MGYSMHLPCVVHSPIRLLFPSLLPLLRGEQRYLLQHNQYLLPFRGQIIPHHNILIDGRFLYPVWNVFERALLSKGTVFPYTYTKLPCEGGISELESSAFTSYHVSTGEKWYKESVHLSRECPPFDSCLLLFTVDRKVAEPLLRHNLI